jgi:sugar (pentulose or hexulose) kinase
MSAPAPSVRDAASTLYLGIDVGTQGVRAALLTGDGVVVGSGACPLRSGRREAGRHEQDPEEWWRALGTATSAARAGRGNRPLGGVSLDATSGTILVQDRQLRPLTPGLMYDDARATDLAAEAAGAGADVWSAFGVTMQPSWALPRAMWLVRNGFVPNGAGIVHQGDHLLARLAGRQVATDSSQSLKTGVDLVAVRWPAEVFDRLGLDVGLLPQVVLPGTVIAEVGAAGAAATDIPEGTPIVAGMTDGCASQIACGALDPGSWSSTLGTTLVIKGATTEPVIDPTGAIYSHRSPDGGWLPGGASGIGAGVIARDFAGADLAALTDAAGTREPAGGVCYPLTGRGERFPFVAPAATGFADGVPADQASRFAAVLQGIAFVERLGYQRLRQLGAEVSGTVSFAGGATANDYWNQLRCDLLGLPVIVPESAAAAVGSAILAAAAGHQSDGHRSVGHPSDRQQSGGHRPVGIRAAAARMVRHSREFEPDPRRAAIFDDAYAAFVSALVDRGWLPEAPSASTGSRSTSSIDRPAQEES